MKTHPVLKITSFLLGLCLAVFINPLGGTASPGETVKVGFFAFDGYHMQDKDGVRSGYGYDLIQFMSGYTDLQFEFVNYDSNWNESQDLLEAGEIDLLTSAQKTPERLERFDFSELPIGISSAILTVKAGNTAYIFDDYEHWSGMRVGMIQGNSRNDRFAEFAVEYGFTYTAVYYEDTEDMLSDLKSGNEIDAAVTSNLRRIEGEWILAQFDPSPFYIIVQKGNTELLAEINQTLKQLHAAMPELNTLLMDKYYLTNSGDNIAFSVEERAIIDASKQKPIKLGIITSSRPICYLDEDSGKFVGVSMEILKAVSNKTGLQFEYLPIDLVHNSPIGWLKAGEFDLVAGIIKVQTFILDPTLVLSDELVADTIVMIGRRGDDFTQNPESKTIALLAGFQVAKEYISAQFPKHKTITCNSVDDCLKAVSNGQADATLYTRSCSSYFLQNPHYENLEVAPAYSMDMSTCLAGLSADKTLLMGILDKGLAMISDTERTAIMMNYTILHPYQMSLGDLIYKYRISISLITALLVLIIAGFALMLSLKYRSGKKLAAAYQQSKEAIRKAEAAAENLRRQILLTKQWQEASETDELTGLLNRRGGEQRIRNLLEIGEKGLFCLFDIDKFKLINDNFGHETGDAALEAMAQCMRSFRGSDVQMRFGGDEFIVFAVGVTTKEQAIVCAEKFLTAIGRINVAGMGGKKLSVSIGMCLCAGEPDLNFNDLYRLADEAMYQCKNSEQEKYRFA